LPVNGRQQTYYIPTENEKRVEERNSSMECMSMEGQFSRKISVKIDKHTRKYSSFEYFLLRIFLKNSFFS